MAADRQPEITDAVTAPAYRISPGDTVKLVVLRTPDEQYDSSVFLEIWEPGGAQPPNSHPASVETFYFLKGEGIAYCDESVVPVGAGQLLVLPPRSTHRIENSADGRLYAITTMTPDAGFAALVTSGTPSTIDEADRSVIRSADVSVMDP